MKASKLSSDEAARQCQSSDAETRLIGCTAVIDQKGKGISSTIALADAFDGRCWAYNDLGQYERGLPDCNASIATNPRRYFAYNTLGNSLLGLGDAANAIAAFTKSIELKPEVIYAHLGRARALAASGNLQMARKDYDYVLTIDPANQSAKDGVAELDDPVVPGGPREETADPPARAAQPKETKTLKEARVFLEDAQKFIASQQTVSGMPAIASAAANLQIALNNFDEAAAVRSMAHLTELLKSISGFEDFAKQQQADRQREYTRQLAEASSEGDKNLYFIDRYLKENLGDPKTSSLIQLRDQIAASQRKAALDEITKANDSLQTYITTNSLSNLYQRIASEYAAPTPALKNQGTLNDRLGITDASKFLIEGPADDIALLYNASPTAPKVWKNVRGDIAFQNDAAAVCFSQPSAEITMLRYTRAQIGGIGSEEPYRWNDTL